MSGMTHIDHRSLSYAGCSCHNTKQARRTVRRAAKMAEDREWQADARDELEDLDFDGDAPARLDKDGVARHVFDAGRCLFCQVNDLDDAIYGPYECVAREPIRHTSETARG